MDRDQTKLRLVEGATTPEGIAISTYFMVRNVIAALCEGDLLTAKDLDALERNVLSGCEQGLGSTHAEAAQEATRVAFRWVRQTHAPRR